MAITKIHPIKKTLNLAIDYITRDDKTDNKILVTANQCNTISAHTQFLKTRENYDVKGTVLARHLIQSFAPGETNPEQAHKIGLELCDKILKGEHEFVISTHIDKGHLHNHIIFNNVNMKTGKCYQSNKKTYHKIRYQSDKLCMENKLSVIDKYYEEYVNKYKINGKSWYEFEQHKQGKSWKSKLQFDIDRTIKKSKDWDTFINNMELLGYEVKFGKHIAFKFKDKKRFTRSKTIGEYYTEEVIKYRIIEANKLNITKARVGKIINKSNNKKVLESKSYDIWTSKHNLKTMSNTVVLMREKGIKSVTVLNNLIKEKSELQIDIQDKIKSVESKIQSLSNTMEQVNIINKCKRIYEHYKHNKDDKLFINEYKDKISMFQKTVKELKKDYDKFPSTKKSLSELDDLNEKKNTLMQEYSKNKVMISELVNISKNYNNYIRHELNL